MQYNFNHYPNFKLETDKPFSVVENLIYTLDSVTYLFTRYFPEALNRPLTVSIINDDAFPVCYREPKTIILNTFPEYWCQAAYQFAHEFCHYMIPYDVCTNMRWFEESLCETASCYFLLKLTKYWKRIGCTLCNTSGEPFADSFTSYVINEMNNYTTFNMLSPVEIANLEQDCYQRAKNRYVASHLLPVFQKYPNTWMAIPFLCQVKENQDFSNSLKEWTEMSLPESHCGVLEICHLFGVSESL